MDGGSSWDFLGRAALLFGYGALNIAELLNLHIPFSSQFQAPVGDDIYHDMSDANVPSVIEPLPADQPAAENEPASGPAAAAEEDDNVYEAIEVGQTERRNGHVGEEGERVFFLWLYGSSSSASVVVVANQGRFSHFPSPGRRRGPV